MEKIFEEEEMTMRPMMSTGGMYGVGEFYHVEVHYQKDYPILIHDYRKTVNGGDGILDDRWQVFHKMTVGEAIDKAREFKRHMIKHMERKNV